MYGAAHYFIHAARRNLPGITTRLALLYTHSNQLRRPSTMDTVGYPENPPLAIFFPLWSLRL